MKELIQRGIQGIVIGVFSIFTLGIVMMCIHGLNGELTGVYLVKQYIVGATMGLVIGLLNTLFTSERLNLLQATMIHFISVTITFILLANYAEWLEYTQWFTVLSLFLTMYVIYWFMSYYIWKKEINKINQQLYKRT